MNIKAVGNFIAIMRKAQGLTQNDLGERLSVSFQSVSKWERGETLPDSALLLDLASVLQTSVDNILSGGEKTVSYKGMIKVGDMREGMEHFKKMGEKLGRNNLIYRYAVSGINEGMNTDVELCFSDERFFECFVAEAVIQSLKNGAYVDMTDVKNGFKYDKYRDIVTDYAKKCNIV